MQAKRWKTVPFDSDVAGRLSVQTGLPPAVGRLLAARGFTAPDEIDAWLTPRLSALSDPFELPDMMPAVERLLRALDRQERVLVYGDYDVDGVTSTALLVHVLRALGGDAVPFLPHRVDDGYGLALEPLERALDDLTPDCIVTVDCGTGSTAAVERARSAGVDVVVTDHHEPGPVIAPALAVINPKRLPAPDPRRHLAGVGVAFKLAHGLLKALRGNNDARAAALDLRQHLDWVALGTIADMVELHGENRALARHGLAQLNRTRKAGLLALKKVARIDGPVDAYHVGFLLGPRLNAAGRLGTAETALALLLTDDQDEADRLAGELDRTNRDRQQVEASMLETAVAQLDRRYDPDRDWGVVVAEPGWHPGVIGIVASRLCARYTRPVVVIAVGTDGTGRGSCRSIASFDMVAGLHACSEHLTRFGGHAMAAGLEIEVDQIPAFSRCFNEVVQDRVTLEALRPEQRIDAWIRLDEVNWPLVETLERMAPFGLGNPRPVWAVYGATLLGTPRIVGGHHLKMKVLQGQTQVEAIAFNRADEPIPDGPLDMAFQLARNTFRGRDTIQMTVQDIRPADLNATPDRRGT